MCYHSAVFGFHVSVVLLMFILYWKIVVTRALVSDRLPLGVKGKPSVPRDSSVCVCVS